jgi:hypothetical protein
VEDMKTLFSKHEHVFLVLVCGRDCIAVVERSEIERVLPIDSPSLAWVSVQTSHNTSLTVEGSNGSLKRKLRKSKPFWRVYEILQLLS